MKDRKIMIIVIITLIVSVIGLGIAFATFSQTLTINGNASVEASNWEIVFEGMTNASSLDNPTVVGTAEEVTHPSIKNNSTEISTYEVLLKTPGDSITYNFKVHNKGSYAANLASLTISGVNRPASPVTGSALVTDSSIAAANASTLAVIEYKFYYTDKNALVGQDAKDCLEPGESENVSLRIVYSTTEATDPSILPASNLVLDNLGISATYNQTGNRSCAVEPSPTPTGNAFVNTDGAYYTYEGKSFIGTGVDNLIISETIPSKAQWSTAYGTDNGEGANPRYTFNDSPAADAAASYCTGCRLMTHAEANSWCGPDDTPNSKCVAKYNGSALGWWLADARNTINVWEVSNNGNFTSGTATSRFGVRPVISISSTATMTGSGTSTSPYVITQ